MSELRRALGPLNRKLALMVGRAIVRLVNDSTLMQNLQLELLAGELRDDVEHVQNYGFTSHPFPGAEAVAVAVAGSRDHVVVVAVDDRRYRLTALEQGEVAIYTDEGDKVVMRRGGVIELTAATKVRIVAPLCEMTGDLDVAGTVTGHVDVIANGTSGHTHTHGGIDRGSSSTDEPD